MGKRLAFRLHELGWDVTAFGRNATIGEELNRAGIRFIQGDLRDRGQVVKACASQDIVFHCGALSSPWGAYRDFYDSNAAGTQHIVDGCLEGGVQRLVYVSTPSIYFNYQDRLQIGEHTPLPAKPANHYAATKVIAEGIVNQAHANGLPSITIRPRAIFGPGDQTLLPRFIRANDERGIPLFRDGNIMMDLTYVDNVVHALLLCANAPDSAMGAAYNITNHEPIRFIDVLRQLFNELGRPLHLRKLPYSLAYGLAGLLEWKARFLRPGTEPLLTRYSVGVLGKHQTLDYALAKETLGYSPLIGMEEGIRQYAQWWKKAEHQ